MEKILSTPCKKNLEEPTFYIRILLRGLHVFIYESAYFSSPHPAICHFL
jgi:hypothetical protein